MSDPAEPRDQSDAELIERMRTAAVALTEKVRQADADLTTACELLRRAAHQLALNMDDSTVLADIGRFLAKRVRG